MLVNSAMSWDCQVSCASSPVSWLRKPGVDSRCQEVLHLTTRACHERAKPQAPSRHAAKDL